MVADHWRKPFSISSVLDFATITSVGMQDYLHLEVNAIEVMTTQGLSDA